MNPWKGFLSTVTVIGAALFSAAASASTVTALPVMANPTTIGVNVASPARPGYNPAGTVTFSESNNTLGTVMLGSGGSCDHYLAPSCDVRLALPGFPLGPHTITASYSGGDDFYAPASLTFTIYVTDLSWLPAVLRVALKEPTPLVSVPSAGRAA